MDVRKEYQQRRGPSQDLEAWQRPGWKGDVAAALSRQPTTLEDQLRPSHAVANLDTAEAPAVPSQAEQLDGQALAEPTEVKRGPDQIRSQARRGGLEERSKRRMVETSRAVYALLSPSEESGARYRLSSSSTRF